MKKITIRTDLIKNLLIALVYVLIGYFFDKLAWFYRIRDGTAVLKIMETISHLEDAFISPLPSFHYKDLLFGLLCGIGAKAIVYYRTKNAKKYRHGIEYGSARWGTKKDIAPYIDPVFEKNVILTQTEFLTMTSRPKNPKHARNKNILVVGGSGSGKTRFFVKPNLMQMHSSYVVTDPKGTVLIECGKMLKKVLLQKKS